MRGVDKIIVNAAGFCIGRYRFRWPDSRKRGIIGNCVPIFMDGSLSEKGVIMGKMFVSVCGVRLR